MHAHYRHLGLEERSLIYALRKAGKTQSEIGDETGFSQSAVSRELARNKGERGYRPAQAHAKAAERWKGAAKAVKLTPEVLSFLSVQIEYDLSPAQACAQAAKELGIELSHESVYKFVAADKAAGGSLYKHLRINNRKRNKKRVAASRERIPDRTGIEHRSAGTEARRYFGDWEADLIVGANQQGYLLTLVDRKSRLLILEPLALKTADLVSEAIIRRLEGKKVRSITMDNGLEFSGHRKVALVLGAKTFFCNPYHSWEKGTVENTNGLVRQYFPKGTSLQGVTPEQTAEAERRINNRPKKVLEWKKPVEFEKDLRAA